MKINVYEKVMVNIFTPLDYLASFLGASKTEVDSLNDVAENIFIHKVRAYERLLKYLKKEDDLRIARKYTNSVCGRLQLRLAVRRGFMSREQYVSLFE